MVMAVASHSDIRRGMISLREAVMRAHKALFADVIQPSDEAFDAIATVLVRYVQVCRLKAQGRKLVALTKAEFALGRFNGGGRRFEFMNDQPSIDDLAVLQRDVDAVPGAMSGGAKPGVVLRDLVLVDLAAPMLRFLDEQEQESDKHGYRDAIRPDPKTG